jgi:hypothetical protein
MRRRAGQSEQRQVEAEIEAEAATIAEESGGERADDHADEGHRDERRVHRHVGIAAVQQRAQHAAGELDVEAVEEHAGADQPQHAPVESGERQAVHAWTGVHGGGAHVSPVL